MARGVKRSEVGPTPVAKRPKTEGSGSTQLKFKSPAEFFAENKNIAGFDNPGKSLYTTVRELVENALDAAEALPTLPDIAVNIERIPAVRFRKLVGVDQRERVDPSLYKDVETAKEKKSREAKERRDAKKRAKIPGADISSQDVVASQESAPPGSQLLSQTVGSQSQSISQGTAKNDRGTGGDILRITVQDNGTGMAHDDVPNMMGRVLAGTKYCVRQSRGKFGLGSKMALIWSKMSTGLPVHVRTAKRGEQVTTCVLDIDIAKNIPTIIKHERSENKKGWHGTEVSVTIAGNWKTYRAKVLLYMRQMAVITPYAQFRLAFDAGEEADDAKNFDVLFSRRTDKMPAPATEVKHHPSSVNQLLLKQLVAEVKSNMALTTFLNTQFVSISRTLATRLITELGSEFTANMPVCELTLNHIRQLDSLLHEARFEKPDGACLSPAGEYNLRLGITKELGPKLVATYAEPADVFEGHPFIVEAGVALGCAGMKPGINVFRFANRIPLLFEGGNDVVTRTAKEDIRWNNYKISTTTEHIGVICSIVSTRIPFKGTGKEYIADDSDTIKAAVKRAIVQCCLQLKTKLVRRAAQKDAAERKKTITRYAPDVANAICSVFENLDDPGAEILDVSDQVRAGKITRNTLLNKLVEHVEQFDKEQALEYAAATGRDQKTLETVFIAPRRETESYIGCELSNTGALEGIRLRLLQNAQSVL